MPPCSVCAADFPKATYSKAQYAKKDGRKCPGCVAAATADSNSSAASATAAAGSGAAGAGTTPVAGRPVELEPCPPPPGRVYFSAVSTFADGAGPDDIIIFGGERTEGRGRKAETKFFKDTFRIAASEEGGKVTHRWLRWPRDAPSPSGRSGHHSCLAAGAYSSRMYMFGGEWANSKATRFVAYNELWLLDLATNTWALVPAAGAVPTARAGMRLASHGELIMMFGGFADDGKARYFNDLHTFNCSDSTWSLVDYAAGVLRPPNRSSFQWLTHGGSVFLFGGYCKIASQKKSKKGKPPPKPVNVAGEPTEDDEFEILGRGVTYTDVWEMQMPSMAWTRLQPTGQVRATPPPPAAATAPLHSLARMRTNKRPKKSGGRTTGPVCYVSDVAGAWPCCTLRCLKLVKVSRVISDVARERTSTSTSPPQRLLCHVSFFLTLPVGQAPSPRLGFGLAKSGSKCIVFGGVHDEDVGDDLESTFYNDVFEFDVGTSAWAPVLLGQAQGPDEAEQSSSSDEEDAAGGGGGDDDEAPELVAVAEDAGGEPEAASPPAAEGAAAAAAVLPPPRTAAGVAVSGGGFIIFGGMTETRHGEVALGDTWRLDLAGQSRGWQKLSENRS